MRYRNRQFHGTVGSPYGPSARVFVHPRIQLWTDAELIRRLRRLYLKAHINKAMNYFVVCNACYTRREAEQIAHWNLKRRFRTDNGPHFPTTRKHIA